MGKLSALLCLALVAMTANVTRAKIVGPKRVEPVVHNGVKYVATNANGREGRIEAQNEKTGEKLWDLVVYKVAIDPNLEEDVQWVFITRLALVDNTLMVTNAKKEQYAVDLKTRKVEKVEKDGGNAATAARADKETNAAEGVAGKVVQMSGNFMPSVGPTRPGRNATKPLSVPVHIFKGKVKVFEKPDVKHPAFLQKVQSDKDGVFRCALPPGEYTIVAEIDGKLYLNSFSGDPGAFSWSTVTVQKGKWTTFDIQDSSKAVF